MPAHFSNSIHILRNTPNVISSLLYNLDESFITADEGENTWSPITIVAHLVSAERSNFYQRIILTLNNNNQPNLPPFDMDAQARIMEGKTLAQLLTEFEEARNNNISLISSLVLTDNDFLNTAIHPTLGTVTIGNIFSAWVAHDLSHIAQIARILAKQYKNEVGAFAEFLNILK